ncbi:SMUG2 DNA glycosylase family protein [Sphingobacterium deserti]|uniref:Uracil-DNA glycosylase-like domain-containing protein n=1 Tax=Sphingobacterium deserti TaxID=1229276 RepID=A0A0B8T5U4_9SPHI|nr:SMUG2 DNA glycosylase family protein [Sphingobacterium deserti]KGE12295.1 hypothetical protein DI53_3945 [Sphingobacterium deserti]
MKFEHTFGGKVVNFNKQLHYAGDLPQDFDVLNPYRDNPETLSVMTRFYQHYYGDTNTRHFIIGINPSRHGAGVTGVPFTDTKRLEAVCNISMSSAKTHEISSVFMYDMIEAFGGASQFYASFYINSPFPLAILRRKGAKWVNANYYDDAGLFKAVAPFMVSCLRKHISIGLNTEEVFVLGKKNAKFLDKLNEEKQLFGRMIVLDHPRFIQQYKLKDKQTYIDKYLLALHRADR